MWRFHFTWALGVLVSACSGGSAGVPGGAPIVAPTSAATASPSVTPVPSPVPSGVPTGFSSIGGCRVFPADNAWNTDISADPIDPHSANFMREMNPTSTVHMHPDFGSDPSYGIPINVDALPVGSFVPITFTGYPLESDPGPYPIPANPAIEAGSDAHMLIVDSANCHLYETFATSGSSRSGWSASNGAVFDLSSDAFRPDGWTSADAAGLPIAAGLVRYDEAQAGAIDHAIRLTLRKTAARHILPARHDAGTSSDPWAPPMGLRLRLSAGFDTTSYHGSALVILAALKRYGCIVADNGSDFYFSGETQVKWDDSDLNQLKAVPASAFEVVATGA